VLTAYFQHPTNAKPWWFAVIYLAIIVIVLLVLFFVSCRDPGLLERVTDEEAANNGWFWNEQVGSYRPAGAMYCRECQVSHPKIILL
jgi:Na+/melibiose symporter-like transporter